MQQRISSVFIFFIFSFGAFAQKVSPNKIPSIIQDFKKDVRGPFLDIKWFCDDGTIREARDPCPDEIGGNQHARYKAITERLHKENELYFSRILTGSEKEQFWNWEKDYDPIKQYLVNKYLESVDDGWILREAQYYRGSVQSEDEMAWSEEFFQWVLSSSTRLNDNYLLIRQAAKIMPHQKETKTGNKVRAISKMISDNNKSFMALRTKIHGNPEKDDIAGVRKYKDEKGSRLSASTVKDIDELITEMEVMFQPVQMSDVKQLSRAINNNPLKSMLEQFNKTFEDGNGSSARLYSASELIYNIRKEMSKMTSGKERLVALDLTLLLEKIIVDDLRDNKSNTYRDLTDRLCFVNQALVGCGYLEDWEYERASVFSQPNGETMDESSLMKLVEHHGRMIEWASNNLISLFDETVQKYSSFEPLAHGFVDDQIRSSMLLPYGSIISDLAEKKNELSETSNEVLNVRNPERIRGLNPGFSKGVLRVIETVNDIPEINKDEIYIFNYPPADLSPVAGIMTVNEGNAVSHVQLLARNLGIPNAVLSEDNLKSLKKFSGDEIFYAVSLTGNVVMKKAKDMNSKEKALFSTKERSEDRITVDINRIDLARDSIVNMRKLDGKDSGISCGPKAANLAQLKKIFPTKVVEGIVMPFGIYRKHMDKPMSTRSMTYWEFIKQIFIDKEFMLRTGWDSAEVECIVTGELEILRENIINIELNDDLKADLEKQFLSAFGKPLGEVPVFLRSDTNMEDLKDFTGAGLNLTKFNILDKEAIYNGIKEVWASPFTERSYKWRQSYLNNPESVFPSILVIPSVDCDYSGVIISKNIQENDDNAMTIAFSRGVGGAVDGQRAETYVITNGQVPLLMTPSRETKYRTIPPTGGSIIESSNFSAPILSDRNITDLHQLVQKVREEMPKFTEMNGPYDIELGFKDNAIWLFQIRPFVENKTAISSEYLQSISQYPSGKKEVVLSKKI